MDLREKYLLFEELTKEYEVILNRVAELELAIEYLKELRDGNGLILFNGLLIKGEAKETNKVIVPVGAKYYVEIDKDKAIEKMAKQLDSLKIEAEKLKNDIDKIKDELKEELAKLQQNNIAI